jgi:hypothetical protein
VYSEEGAICHHDRHWRWRFIAANGKIMADGGEAYATAANARRAIVRFASLVSAHSFITAPIETVTWS